VDHELVRFPPVLQLLALGLLAAYVALSIAARAVPGLRWLWRDRADVKTGMHLFEYTLLPALILAVAAAAVVVNWDPDAPLDGGWRLEELVIGPGAALLGLVLVLAGQSMGKGAAGMDPSRPLAWMPLVVILAGIGVMAVGVTTLGKTVKRAEPRAAAPLSP
jgi:hypothetical protein